MSALSDGVDGAAAAEGAEGADGAFLFVSADDGTIPLRPGQTVREVLAQRRDLGGYPRFNLFTDTRTRVRRGRA